MPTENIKEMLKEASLYCGLGFIGGVAMHFNQIRKGEKFRFWIFVANIFLAMWIGYIAGSFIPSSIGDIKYSIVSICGFLSYPLLDFIERKGLTLIIKRILGLQK